MDGKDVCMMERLTVFQTDKGRYSVRPIDWEGIWDKQGKIQEKGFNHTGIFQEKEDAEFFARTKNLEEEGKLLKLPCKQGDTVYIAKKVYYAKEIGINEVVTARVIRICSSRNEEGEIIWCIKVFERYGEYLIPFEEFGKTVFLTEQEAKEALERIKK